jgi:signal transduction histidine kinase
MAQLLDLFGRPDEESEKGIFTLLERCASQAMKTHPNLTIKLKAPAAVKHTRIVGGRLLPMVFDNLFRNAAQHAGKKPKVHVGVTTQDNDIQIDIRDNGPGIPKKLRSKLFLRGVSTTGSGLGLNLSKRILEAYDGSIELLEEKRGAAFQILLPLEES